MNTLILIIYNFPTTSPNLGTEKKCQMQCFTTHFFHEYSFFLQFEKNIVIYMDQKKNFLK